MGKRELWQLRNELHETVYTVVRDGCVSVRELREPTDAPEKHIHSGKIIGLLRDREQAEVLKSMIEDEIAQTNERMKAAARTMGGDLPTAPIKYKISMIECIGDVALSRSAAQRRIGITGEVLKKEIIEHIDRLQKREFPDDDAIQAALAFLNSIDVKALYADAVDSGTAYRVSWYDAATYKRCQRNVGHILLVVGGEGSRIVDAPMRKARSDRAQQLYCYERPGVGGTMLHRIYPYDMRYANRRKITK